MLILLIPFLRDQQLVGGVGMGQQILVKVGNVENGYLATPFEQGLQGADVVLDQGDIELALQVEGISVAARVD